MPSLWKKQKEKGNRISRLVADLQSPTKRGGNLVVETGFPTSIVDLFHKNRDRLRKPSKKKHRTNQLTISTSTTTPESEFSFPVPPSPVSDPYVYLSKFDLPTCSIDDMNRESVSQRNYVDYCVEETVGPKSPRIVELNRNCCNDNEGEEEEDEDDNVGVSYSKKGVWMSVTKGALVVVVALYTKRFVVGITFGALLLLLLEYVGKSILRFFRPCDSKRKLGGYRNQKKVKRGILKRAVGISSKGGRERRNMVVSERGIEQEIENDVIAKREIGSDLTPRRIVIPKREFGNDLTPRMAVTPKREIGNDFTPRRDMVQEDGDFITSKGEIEQENVGGSLVEGSSYLVKELSCKSDCEIEANDPNFCVWLKSSNCGSIGGYCEVHGKKCDMEGGEIACRKKKKGKKFWKKFVPKHMHSKKKKHKRSKKKDKERWGHELFNEYIEEINGEFEDDDELDEATDGEESSLSTSSSSDDEDGGEFEHFGAANIRNTKRLHINNKNAQSIENVNKSSGKLKCLAIVGVALAGLVRGRIFALVLTVVCCLIFKILRC